MSHLRLRKIGYWFLWSVLWFGGLIIIFGRARDWSLSLYAFSLWDPYVILSFLISLFGVCIIFLPSLSNFVTQKNLVILIGISIGCDLIMFSQGLKLHDLIGTANMSIFPLLVHLYLLYFLFKDRARAND